jgi:hypothetical protein
MLALEFFMAIQARSDVRKGYLLAHSSHAWFDRTFFLAQWQACHRF